MNLTVRRLILSIFCYSFLIASSFTYAKQTEIGIAAVAIEASLVGKGQFVVNDTLDEGDSLKTGEKGNTTILFSDESMLTLGSNAHASVEVFVNAKDGKPGRSIIRVHKGQFRYFPGSILENGGSQFVAVGNKLLGKSATGIRKTSPNLGNSQPNQTAEQQADSKQENGNSNKSNTQLASANTGEGSTGNNGGVSGSIQGPPINTGPGQTQANNTSGNIAANPDAPADGDSGNNDTHTESAVNADSGVTRSDTNSDGGVEVDNSDTDLIEQVDFIDVALGSDGPEATGGNGGGNQDNVDQDRGPDVLSGNNSVGDNGFDLFIENGISGNVAKDSGSFRGNVDVFGSTGGQVGFIGSITSGNDIGLHFGDQTGLKNVTGVSTNTNISKDVLPIAGSVRVLDTDINGKLPSVPTTSFTAPIDTFSVPTTTFEAPTATFTAPTTTFKAPTTTFTAPTTTFKAPTTTFTAPTTTFRK